MIVLEFDTNFKMIQRNACKYSFKISLNFDMSHDKWTLVKTVQGGIVGKQDEDTDTMYRRSGRLLSFEITLM